MVGEVEEGLVVVPLESVESVEVESTEEVLVSSEDWANEDRGADVSSEDWASEDRGTGTVDTLDLSEAKLGFRFKFMRDSRRAARKGEMDSVFNSCMIRGLGGRGVSSALLFEDSVVLLVDVITSSGAGGSGSPALRSPALTALAIKSSNFSLAPTKSR